MAPTVAAGTAAGSTATATVDGNDMCGVVTVTLSASRTADGGVFSIAFASCFDRPPVVIVEADEAVRAAELAGGGSIWELDETDVTREGFTVRCVNSETLPGANGSSQMWRYIVASR